MKKILDDDGFDQLITKLKKQSFSDNKREFLESQLKFFCLNCKQGKIILECFSFDDDKVKVCPILYPCLTDAENVDVLLSAITFSSKRKDVKAILNQMPIPNNSYFLGIGMNFKGNFPQNNYNNDFYNQSNYNQPNFNNNYNQANFNYNYNQPNYNNNCFNQPNFISTNQVRKILDQINFQKALDHLNNKAFLDDKLTILENLIKFYFLNCFQLDLILQNFDFDDEKVKVAVLLYPYLSDLENFEYSLDKLTFDSTKKDIRNKVKNLSSYYTQQPANNISVSYNYNGFN